MAYRVVLQIKTVGIGDISRRIRRALLPGVCQRLAVLRIAQRRKRAAVYIIYLTECYSKGDKDRCEREDRARCGTCGSLRKIQEGRN